MRCSAWVIAIRGFVVGWLVVAAHVAVADPRPYAVAKQALRGADETPATPSPSTVAKLYVEVGHALRAHATDDPDASARLDALIARYRYIQVQDAMADPRKRRATVAELLELRRRVAR